MFPTIRLAPMVLAALLAGALPAGRTAEARTAADSLAHRSAVADSLARGSAAAEASAAADSLPRPAPDFMLPDLDGMPHRFLGYPGRVHMLVYWSPECPECKQDLPRLWRLYAREKARGLALVSVVGARLGAEAVAYAKEKGYDFPILLDTTGKVVRMYDVRLTPLVCVVRGGRVLFRHAGFDPAVGDSLPGEVESLLH